MTQQKSPEAPAAVAASFNPQRFRPAGNRSNWSVAAISCNFACSRSRSRTAKETFHEMSGQMSAGAAIDTARPNSNTF